MKEHHKNSMKQAATAMRKFFRLRKFRQKQEEWCSHHHHHRIDLEHDLAMTRLVKANSLIISDEGEEGTLHSSNSHFLVLDDDDNAITDTNNSNHQEQEGDHQEHWSSLPTDIHLTILSYLDAPSLNNMMRTNRAWCTFLQSPDANRLWLKHSQRIWKIPSSYYYNCQDENDKEDFLWNNLKLTNDDDDDDDDGSRRGCTCPEGVCSCDKEEQVPSLHRLLSKTAQQQPSTMYPLNFGPAGSPFSLRVFQDQTTLSLRINHEYYNSQQIFVARADAPLARPTRVLKKNKKRLKQIVSLLKRKKKGPQWNAFVSPYSIAGENSTTAIHVAPRLVSYFEITVESPQDTHHRYYYAHHHERRTVAPEWDVLQRLVYFLYGHDAPFASRRHEDRDCIIIGLAPKHHEHSIDLPGWDEDSFGYHSDSGGLYHGFYDGMGAAFENTEPFDNGDTVGMGIDYVRRGLFVTKNGKLLGLYFDRLKVDYLASTDLYPVVGMDTKDTVVVNYGGCGKPFLFDLADYCQKGQRELALKQKK